MKHEILYLLKLVISLNEAKVLEQHIGLWNTSSKFIVIIPSRIPIRCQSPRETFNQVIQSSMENRERHKDLYYSPTTQFIGVQFITPPTRI